MTEHTRMTNGEILKSLDDKIKEATTSLAYLNLSKSSFMSVIRDEHTNIEEPEIHITKPECYDAQTIPGYKTLYDVVERETSKRWTEVLSNLIDELGGDSPAFWEWNGITPTPEKVVECIRELIELREKLAADEELNACCDWVEGECPGYDRSYEQLRKYRRPQPTLKSQALRDFQTVRENCIILPEILDTIENALKSIPE